MDGARDEKGDVWIEDIDPLSADTLRRMPEWLDSRDPAVRDRLLPPAYEDPEDEKQWRRFGAPELEHLFASRLEIIRKDLASLERTADGSLRLRIPRAHEAAWLSSLNAVRHTLFILNRLTEADMAAPLGEMRDLAKLEPLIRINLLAHIQQLLID